MKELNGAELAGYMKANQAHTVKALRSRKIFPKLVIIRNNDSPVIQKYVSLKQRYGEDIGVAVEDWYREDILAAIHEANTDEAVDGIIVQLPLAQKDTNLDEILAEIAPEKDVDGLATDIHLMDNSLGEYLSGEYFESATATAVNWLLAGYDVPMEKLKIAIVGRGRLVGKPLARMWRNSGYDIAVFHRGDDLLDLVNYDLIVSATGQAHLIKDAMVRLGAYVVDAGTASEGGVLVGDVDDSVRDRTDLAGITPKVGGVGPLTVTALFEHVLIAASKK